LIARYRDASQRRKAEYLADEADLQLRLLCPAEWKDDLLQTAQQATTFGALEQWVLPMVGQSSDPHRAWYRTLTFGLRRFQPQIIHAEEEPDSLAALQLALARRLFAPHARLLLHSWQNVDRPKGAAVMAVLRQTLRSADGIFCANQAAVQLLRTLGYQRPTPVTPAIGVDTELFRPCAERRGAGDPFVVGYLGRLVPEKGIDLLIQAVASLVRGGQPVRLRLIGGGPERDLLAALAAAEGISERVEFIAPIPPALIAPALCRLDCLVLPSRGTPVWEEQLGRVLLEAMASGVPVIGSSSGAIPEVIGEGGLVFPEGDVAALAVSIERLRSDPALRHALAAVGLTRAQEVYAQRALARRTADFYREIVA
jgi:glycosyltransferase involved in cell wall biosynthesis